jgi:hypothetical protein
VTILIRLILYNSYITLSFLTLNPFPTPLKAIARGFFVLFHIGVWSPSTIYSQLWGSHYVVQAGFELATFLPLPPKCWGYRCVSLHPAKFPLFPLKIYFINSKTHLSRSLCLNSSYQLGHCFVWRARFQQVGSRSTLYYICFYLLVFLLYVSLN